MVYLKSISLTFNTHNDDRDADTVLHVFIKNRQSTSADSESNTTYIANLLAYQEANEISPFGINPYLGMLQGVSLNAGFSNPSSHQFNIPLRPAGIPIDEIILPVVNIHILPKGNDRWIFDFKITFTFDDGRQFSYASNVNGITGIILDQDNRDYSGICTENPFKPLPAMKNPAMNAVLDHVTLEFATHNDNKDGDTVVNVHILNRLNSTTSQDILVALAIFHGEEFPDPSLKREVFTNSVLASKSIRLEDMVLPVVYINITPKGNDRWIFDYRVTYTFSNGLSFASTTIGVVLDQDNHKHGGVYRGNPFPTVTPLGKPTLSPAPVDHTKNPKMISLAFLEAKLNEFINTRQGVGGQLPPITRIRLHHTGLFGPTLPQSYYDLQSIEANPIGPDANVPVNYVEGVEYDSNPTEIGQLTGTVGIGDLYLNNINSKSLTANVDSGTGNPTPITVQIDFDCSGPDETLGSDVGTMNFKSFYIRLRLTLALDTKNFKVDVMSWADEINGITYTPIQGGFSATGTFLGKPIQQIVPSASGFKSELIDQVIHVDVVTTKTTDPGGIFQKEFRGKLFDKLTTKNAFDGTTLRDSLNSYINSLLLGGVIEGSNRCKVTGVSVANGHLNLTYTGPQNTFVFPATPGWPPTPADFAPGALANIDHIVVLTMENRSFDQMLGYLSLPIAHGGAGRTEVDGLKGGEFNMYKGVSFPSIPFAPGQTVFSPDPPHNYEPVQHAINNGKMDGFVESYAKKNGPANAPRIMGYHTPVNIPTYDALARDFAICHRWFANHPGPTFCNRFYELSGRLNIDADGQWETSNSSSIRPSFARTIFDELYDRRVSWKYFESGYCFLRFFEAHTFDSTNIVTFEDPVSGFVALAKSGKLPSVSYIDPHFIELPPGGNCDGPPADVRQGQLLVQKVVEAVVSGPNWNKTLLVVTYDEHGGFFDHVAPPPAARVSPESLGTYGVRVPAFIVSPWVTPGSVFGRDGVQIGVAGGGAAPAAGGSPLTSLHFDHTSILKTIARRFMNVSPPYLGPRYAAANDLSLILEDKPRSSQFLPFIPYTITYGSSKKCLDVEGSRLAPGTLLWQYDPNGTIAQQFSFEDAGAGYFRIRTNTGGFYVTVDAGLVTNAPQYGIKLDVKYPLGGGVAENPDYQRWAFDVPQASVTGNQVGTLRSAAFPGKLVHPEGERPDSGTRVVLEAAAPPASPVSSLYQWVVASSVIATG